MLQIAGRAEEKAVKEEKVSTAEKGMAEVRGRKEESKEVMAERVLERVGKEKGQKA